MSAKQNNQPLVGWEEAPGFLAAVRSFFSLCGQLLLRPADFFRQLHSRATPFLSRRLGKAVFFALVLGYMRLGLDVVNAFWFQSLGRSLFSAAAETEFAFFSIAELSASPFFLLRPVVAFAVTLALVSAGVKMVLGFDKPLSPALLIVAYKSVSELFYCIPVVGGIFAASWSLALLAIGARELYRASVLRSFLAVLVAPFLIIFFLVFSTGAALTRAVILFYPQAQTHLQKINDMTAYATTVSIVEAAAAYKKELGFYPPHLEAMHKYLTDMDAAPRAGGYVYDYRRLDDRHFVLEVKPLKPHETGRFVFYADEAGGVRLGGLDGRRVGNLREFEEIFMRGPEKEKQP